ncbi:MAG TPA: hypothetical protein VE843_04595, partial [Ktedonobacteraceae bacterium]|nr:hypothetical protein [Ktedonobacteraceae bacterium]
MSTQSASNRVNIVTAQSSSFDRFAALCAILAGIVGLLYSISFVLLKNDVLIALFLMLGGVFSTAVLVAVYNHLKETDSNFAFWALFLSIAGAFGAIIHGGYDLANAINPSAANVALANLPSAIDPRGLLTFGVTGFGIFVIAWLMGHSRQFPRGLSYWGYLLAVLLVVLYLGRLIILDPKNPIVLVDAL